MIRFDSITKRFPGVVALDQVSLEIAKGECHALMGENGAGKSTLGKILAGVYSADSGRIFLEDKAVSPETPLEAKRLGIAIVHQELAFCPNLTVAENLCLGELPRRAGFFSPAKTVQRARAMLDQIEAPVDPRWTMSTLSTAQEQLVQIAAAVGSGARLIVMDEPTSSLSAKESEHLFTLLARLKERGVTIIYVSHRMEEIFRLADRVSVLRDGRHIGTSRTSETTPERLIQQMIGRELASFTPSANRTPGTEALRVENLSSPGKFEKIRFTLRRGEILGFAGLVGAGRSEVAHAIFGLDPNASGEIYVNGQLVKMRSPEDALRARIGFLPEDRKRQGLVLSMNCRENTSLAAVPALTRAGFIRRGSERKLALEYSEKLRVKTPDMNAPISGLSGGNQQKIALAKWLARESEILIVDEPTRGVDVGVKTEIHHLLDDLAASGKAILLISSELPEVMSLSHRILVMREGVQMGELDRAQFSQAALLRLMAGVQN